MSFPLLVRTAQSAFQEVNPRFEDIARTLGAGEWRVFRTISLPLALPGVVVGTVLAFARAMGEFGATVVVAGMIPRRTMTISLAIYQKIQLGHDAEALPLLFVSIGIVFITVLCGQLISRRKARGEPATSRCSPSAQPASRWKSTQLSIGRSLVIFGPSGARENFPARFDCRPAPANRRNSRTRRRLCSPMLPNHCIFRSRTRRIGYVPQDLAFFPHLSVRANLVYGYEAASSRQRGVHPRTRKRSDGNHAALRPERDNPFRRRTTASRVCPGHPFGAASAFVG